MQYIKQIMLLVILTISWKCQAEEVKEIWLDELGVTDGTEKEITLHTGLGTPPNQQSSHYDAIDCERHRL